MALERIDPAGNRGLHVSFDIDALDAKEAPSTILPSNNNIYRLKLSKFIIIMLNCI